ncbi:MAG: class I SAM-dependent methyltransferase [Lachnospiraceae bacterium]|nr:class I SAM-dependent methyltransferase [Lachnospiraceae bacterium]MBQ2406159.1 class I SAM-dependent methyltransferase [Lachnospiraceae bacterium]MBQ5849422.1 class I SAM-dependent methyltransferase [Lachnospiraceae bacterium]MEE0920508.1 class I SAM-dependent methyltransferase [Lachnospiraceae bacterium]
MEQYTDFAMVYDKFMDETPYEKWCENVVNELQNYDIKDGLVLELGCGTGSMTELMAAKGYDMIGIDCAQEMLNIAYDKKEKSGYDILYLNQDMREFELYGTVRAVISVCDSVNYLLMDEDLIECFKLVNNYLDPKGIFFFDFNTVYKYKEVIGDTVIAENREDCSFIWENFFDVEENINEYDLTIFAKHESGLFEKFEETHFQRGYTLEEMKHFIEAAGMKFLKAYDADTLGEVTPVSERVYCVAQEISK